MKRTITRLLLFSLACVAGLAQPAYLDPRQPIDRRIEDLLARMTLEEKIGQMNMPCVYERRLGRDVPSKLAACRRWAEGTFAEGIGPGGGFFTLADNILPGGAREKAIYFNELQKIAGNTRLRIPLLQTEEGTHGVMCSGMTIFPEGLGIGSTWNMDLVRRIYSAAAQEARSVGIHQLYTLVIEPNRDPRMGRNEEGYSEDPYLCSRIAESIVRGAQGADVSAADKVVAGLCHYPGQSQPAGGLEQGPMEISERILREVFLPPWVAGIRKSGALGVMATYPSIDGVATHGSEKLLTKILREELGFEGLVLGEGAGISTLIGEHMAAAQKDAGQLALRAGLDVGISLEPGYMQLLAESVKEGKASMADVDRAVRRILRQKFRLGLFENRYADPNRAERLVHSAENQQLALQAAREGIVLLKNENGLLPLSKKIGTIAVIGPNADEVRNQLGDYTSKTITQDVVTILEGIRKKVSPETKVLHVKGCDILGMDPKGIAEAQKGARQADLAIVVVGERQPHPDNPRLTPTNGEPHDMASLDLTGQQQELVEAVHATGKPMVVVLVNGRPLSVRWIAEHVPAIVEAWSPGERGGDAVADVLFGDYNPSGRLAVSVPRHSGQLPIYYNFKPSRERRRYVDMESTPLFHFGFGLSYTTFEYSNLQIAPKSIRSSEQVRVSVDVRNAGGRAGEEVVQLYIRDLISSVSRPVKELKGFEKISLKPGETRTVQFALSPDELSFLNARLERVVEPGVFSVMVGSSVDRIRLSGNFEVATGK